MGERLARCEALERRRDDLYDRLQECYRRIMRDTGRVPGAERWHDRWATLLADYEATGEELRRALCAPGDLDHRIDHTGGDISRTQIADIRHSDTR